MTDILYVIGGGAAKLDNKPLRWSLRSLAKFGKNVGRIVVVGSPPKWLSDRVVKLETVDKTKWKHWNILYCIAEAIRRCGLDKPFLYSSDDHYLCKTADMDLWPRYARGNLYTFQEIVAATNRLPGAYKTSIVATRKLMERLHLSIRRANLHLNTWMDGRYLPEVLRIAEGNSDLSPRFGFEPTCLFNAIHERLFPNEKYEEYQFDSKVKSVRDIERKMERGLPGFSTDPKAEADPEVAKWLDGFFPEKSPWEA